MEWVVLDDLPDPGPFRGLEGTRAFWEMWKDTFDEFRAEIEEYVEADGAVIMIVRMVGRGKDSGVSVDTPSFPMVWTIRDDRVVRMQMFTSRDEALESVGLPPATPFQSFDPR
jgi:ketosteroid isomerase-like protein